MLKKAFYHKDYNFDIFFLLIKRFDYQKTHILLVRIRRIRRRKSFIFKTFKLYFNKKIICLFKQMGLYFSGIQKKKELFDK